MLVYPKNNHKTDSETIFFIGHALRECFINGVEIDLIAVGNFCPVFKLNPGENFFDIVIDDEALSLTVFREVGLKRSSQECKLKAWQLPEPSKRISKICLDPGHGANQLGTCSPKGVFEKDLNLSLALVIKAELEKMNFDVLLTRESDVDISLEQRVQIAKGYNCDLFLSIHHNAVPDDQNPLEHHGISAHYYYEHSKALSLGLAHELALKLDLKNNGAICQNLFVTRENLFSQAILLECGFLIHPIESEKIIKKQFQLDLAKYLAMYLAKFS